MKRCSIRICGKSRTITTIVVSGHGLIQERNITTGETVEFEVSGDKIEAIHMIPGWTHNIHGESAGTVFAQLALAHTYGTGKLDSCRNAAKAVSELLYGIKIDHYVSFTMDTVAAVNDMVGGVTVTITDDMTSVSPQMYKGATVTLQGDMALSYVRARGSLADSSNLKRMERQRLYVKELVGKLSEKIKTDEYFLRELFNGVSSYITSDCTVNQIIRLSEGWEELTDWELKTIDGEAIVGDEFMEFYPNEEALKELVLDSFYVPLDE